MNSPRRPLPRPGRAARYSGHVAPPRISRRAAQPRLAGAGRRAEGHLGPAQEQRRHAATTGRPARSIRKSPRRSTSTTPRATTTASAATPRATRSASCARPRTSASSRRSSGSPPRPAWPMPERDPAAAARAAANQGLVEAMEAAVQFYRLQLATARAAEARAYLDRRGLAPATRDRFEIGYRARQPHRAARASDRQGLRPRAAGRGRPRRRCPRTAAAPTTASAAASSSRSATPAAAPSPSAPARSRRGRSRST